MAAAHAGGSRVVGKDLEMYPRRMASVQSAQSVMRRDGARLQPLLKHQEPIQNPDNPAKLAAVVISSLRQPCQAQRQGTPRSLPSLQQLCSRRPRLFKRHGLPATACARFKWDMGLADLLHHGH